MTNLKMDISTQDLWDELYKELLPDIPKHAKTVRQIIEDAEEKGEILKVHYVRDVLNKKHKDDGWIKKEWKGIYYYWPPES